jgi:hypothetical protein
LNGTVRSVIISLYLALIGCDMAHNIVTNRLSIRREGYKSYDLHLNSRGMMRLTHLIAESMFGGHVPNMSGSIPGKYLRRLCTIG